MPYFQYGGKQCWYEEEGEGEPLLFLHGNTASSRMFRDLYPAFTGRYRTVLLDFYGHGRSERAEKLAADLWYDEAQQTIAFLEQAGCRKAHLLGCSGGAIVALNVALERPDLVGRVIADSFEGERALTDFLQELKSDREASKREENAAAFYRAMHGADWERVVEQDTAAILEHASSIGAFFHRPLSEMQADVLLTGSLEDEFVQTVSPDFFEKTYSAIICKMGKGRMHLFEHGGHPAALSNREAFAKLAQGFLAG